MYICIKRIVFICKILTENQTRPYFAGRHISFYVNNDVDLNF